MYYLTVLEEARHPEIKVLAGLVPSEVYEEDSFVILSLVCRWPPSPYVSLHCLPLCVSLCLQMPSFYKDTSHIGLGPILNDLILM